MLLSFQHFTKSLSMIGSMQFKSFKSDIVSSAIHKNADVDLMHFKNIKIYHKDVPIKQQLNNALWAGVEANRKILWVLVQARIQRGNLGIYPPSIFWK